MIAVIVNGEQVSLYKHKDEARNRKQASSEVRKLLNISDLYDNQRCYVRDGRYGNPYIFAVEIG